MKVAARRGPGRLRILVGSHGGTHALTVLGEVDPHSVSGLEAALSQALDAPGCTIVIVDLQAVARFSSHGLTAVLEARREARSRGRAVQVVLGANPAVLLVLRAAGLDQTVFALDTVQDAPGRGPAGD